jgi:hypothetical protein
MIGSGRNRHAVTLIAKPSKTNIAMLSPMLNVNLSIPLSLSLLGNNTAINTYPGRNSSRGSAKMIRNG